MAPLDKTNLTTEQAVTIALTYQCLEHMSKHEVNVLSERERGGGGDREGSKEGRGESIEREMKKTRDGERGKSL